MQADIEFDLQQKEPVLSQRRPPRSHHQARHIPAIPGASASNITANPSFTHPTQSTARARPKADYPFVDFFRDADLLIFDAQYTLEQVRNDKRDWGHSDHSTALDLAARAEVKKLLMFHHEPNSSDAEIEGIHSAALELHQARPRTATRKAFNSPTTA